MSPLKDQREATSSERHFLNTTHWSIVIAAGQSQSPQSDSALATLCETYWYPLYAFVRRQGFNAEKAEDLTQDFFAKLLEKNYVGDADQQRGRFRSFLLTALKHFLSNERDRVRAKKRGGGRVAISLDFPIAEDRYQCEPSDPMTPGRLYERRWALTLLERVLNLLRDEYSLAGNLALFDALKGHLTREKGSIPYREVAEILGLSEGAVKVAVHRLRRRYRDLLESEIAHTVSDTADVEDEMRQLFTALSSENATPL
jgi:RNA polymerase sigma factor (sigma-70 family)